MTALELLKANGLSLSSPATARFWAYVDVPRMLNDCWLWKAGTTNGYGQIRSNGATIQAHRFSYELLVGPIPDGLEIDHLCRERSCVNPAHLEPVTTKVNVLRGEGTPAVNARKTHCRHGHAFTPENTYLKDGRHRECRKCWQERRNAARAAAGEGEA